jgi:hypothetical protein
MRQAHEALEQVRKLRARLQELRDRAGKGKLADAIAKLEEKLAPLAAPAIRGTADRTPSLPRLSVEMGMLLNTLQGADATPTTQAVAACGEVLQTLTQLLARWNDLRDREVKALNEQLRQADLPPLDLKQPAFSGN